MYVRTSIHRDTSHTAGIQVRVQMAKSPTGAGGGGGTLTAEQYVAISGTATAV